MTDEADNNLGIKTDKNLVEYGQYVINKMNKEKINLWNATLDNNKPNINSTPKPKTVAC
ncbi:MAG: hypothetical protein LBH98_02380 [Chitinispirillales bacterium]|nr:hypothetical protein [Chitinispirillales bacterium]